MTRYPGRWVFICVETTIAVAGTAGALQLATGSLTPPVSDLEPLGLSSWTLPGAWLFASVGVPSAVAAVLAWRRSRHTPIAVLVASVLLAAELLVQIPFVGPSVLQVVMGTVAIAMAGTAVYCQRRGWNDIPSRTSAAR